MLRTTGLILVLALVSPVFAKDKDKAKPAPSSRIELTRDRERWA